MPYKFVSVFLLGVLSCVASMPVRGQNSTSRSAGKVQEAGTYTLEYTKDGHMVPPANYREWIFLSSGLGMNYGANAADHEMFDNVFVNPEAYRSFLRTGTWPDKTVLILELRGAKSKGSINRSGHFQDTGLMGLEAHVKDEARVPGKWAFFDFDGSDGGTLLPQTASCYSCHADHAAVDTTFVQFYPTLLPLAQKKATLSPAYLKELDPPAK